jgi:hypothetical protein
MRWAIYKLIAAVALMPMAVLGLRVTRLELFFLVFIVGFVLSILWWMDLGRLLRAIEQPTSLQRVLGILFGIPQALFGLLCIVAGGSMVAWVLWNSVVQQESQYSGGFLTFGIGPMLVLFGAGWVVYAFKRDPTATALHTAGGEPRR